MDWYIGLDIGTTNIKACAFSPSSLAKRYVLSIPTPKSYTGVSLTDYEYDADELFAACCQVLRQLIPQLPKGNVRALALSSMAESGILLNKNNVSLCRAVPWFDSRSRQQAEALSQKIGQREIFQITGQFSSSKFGITKLLWHKETCPDIFAHAAHWASLNDYILFRFSGVLVSDYSIAARTMAFDIRNLTWSQTLLDAGGLSRDFFPDTVPGGTSIHPIQPDVAAFLEVPDSVLIVTGGHDHACAAIGSGVLMPGSLLDSMGTSEVILTPLSQPVTSDALFLAQTSIYPHCSDTLYRALTSMQACGASINWFLDSIGNPIAQNASRLNKDAYLYLSEIASDCEECSELQYYPFIRGSLSHPNCGGAFLGIRDHHRIAHFAKALLDGLCNEFTFQMHSVSDALTLSINKIQVVGGPSQLPYLMQRKADISSVTIQVPLEQQAACLGAAFLAAIGCGDMTFSEILGITSGQSSEVFTPAAATAADAPYNNYLKFRKLIGQEY